MTKEEKLKLHNKEIKSQIKTLYKKAIEKKTVYDINTFKQAIDSAASKNIIHNKKANRLKSKIDVFAHKNKINLKAN